MSLCWLRLCYGFVELRVLFVLLFGIVLLLCLLCAVLVWYGCVVVFGK